MVRSTPIADGPMIFTMAADFYPKRELDIVAFSARFAAGIATRPSDFGLLPEQTGAYTQAQQVFADLVQLASSGGTRTPSVIKAKNAAKRVLEKMTRQLAGTARSHQGVTTVQRLALGLALRGRGRPRGSRTSDGRATLARCGPPRLMAKVLQGRTLRITLRDRSEPTSRSMPKGVASATVFHFAGERPPPVGDSSRWTFLGVAMRTVLEARLGGPNVAYPPGTRIWLTARWETGGRGEGPLCAPVYVHTQYYTNAPGAESALAGGLRAAA